MGNRSLPEYKKLWSVETDAQTFSHEIGHILFKTGHNETPSNLMKDIDSSFDASRGNSITQAQCKKAREILEIHAFSNPQI